MISTFVDANIILEILLSRSRSKQCEKLLSEPKETKTYYVSALSVHLVYHFCEIDKVDRHLALVLLAQFNILPISRQTVRLAQQRYGGRDFEDCLQAACAELDSCDEIVTIDRQFARRSGTRLPVQLVK